MGLLDFLFRGAIARAAAPPIGGIEALHVDGTQYWFGYSYTDDQVLTPLFADAETIAVHAVEHMTQRDGRKDHAFWRAQALDALAESGLSNPLESFVLAPFRAAVAALRDDPVTARPLPDIVLPSHVNFLLEANCDWPDTGPPPDVLAAVVRLELEVDDSSPWWDETAAILADSQPLPTGAAFADAARVQLWCVSTVLGNQRHGWAEQLGLVPE